MNDIQTTAQQIAEEIITVKSEVAFRRSVDLVEGYWHIGQVLIQHPSYKKFAHGQGELRNAVAKIVGMDRRSLDYCGQFYEKYPSERFDDVLPKLAGGKSPVWREIVQNLPSGRREKETVENTCAHEWHCQKCGATKK